MSSCLLFFFYFSWKIISSKHPYFLPWTRRLICNLIYIITHICRYSITHVDITWVTQVLMDLLLWLCTIRRDTSMLISPELSPGPLNKFPQYFNCSMFQKKKVKWDFKKWSKLKGIQWSQWQGQGCEPLSPLFLGTCAALPSSFSGTQTNRGQQGKGSTNEKYSTMLFLLLRRALATGTAPLRLQTLLLGPHVPLPPTREPSQRQHCVQGTGDAAGVGTGRI